MDVKKNNITVNDLAKAIGTSASTVSRALNDHPKISQAMKEKVRNMALKMGYTQGQLPILQKNMNTNRISIVVPALTQTKYAILVESARKILEESGFECLLLCTSESEAKEKKHINYLNQLNIAGVIGSLTYENKNPKHYVQLAQTKPLVLFDRISFEMPCNKIMIDHFQAGFRAVQHLLNIGSKNIAHIGGNINCPLTKQIATGYKTALRNGGLKTNPKFELFSDHLTDDVIKAAELIYNQKERPDAILIDDILASQKLISMLQTRKIKIPDDVAIVAIGDEKDYSYYSPSITTIQLPYAKVGKKAAEVLLDQINGKGNKSPELFVEPFNLNIRNSTLR